MCAIQKSIERHVQVMAAIVVMVAAVAHAQPQPAQGDQPNRIVIEYVKPQSPDLQNLYEVLQTVRSLERVQTILSPLRLPEPLKVRTTECGKVNAFYGKVPSSGPTVTVCYELLKHLLESLPSETNVQGIQPDDAKIGQGLWIILHEVGHAAFDLFNVPIFGKEEDAADNFATYVLLQFAEAHRLIVGAAWAWNEYMQDYKRDPVVRIRLRGFADEHGQPQARFYNLACLAFGSDSVGFAKLQAYLPPTRAESCAHDYAVLAAAFRKEIHPHIDLELAKRVVESSWLPGPVLRETPKQ